MKYPYYLSCCLFALATTGLPAQTGIFVTGGSTITNGGEITVVDGDVEISDGALIGGTLILTGFSGPDNNLVINNDRLSLNWLRLEDGAQVSFEGGVSLNGGLWIDSDSEVELMDATIVVREDAFLDGATNNISSPAPGNFILHYEDHNPDNPGLLGNIGIKMEPSNENLGLVDLYRRYGGVSVNGQPTLARHYQIHPGNNNIAEFELKFRLPDEELEGIPREELRLYHSMDGAVSWVLVDAEDRYENFEAEIVPKGLFAFSTANALPVELLDFTAVATGKRNVDCRWETAHEAGSSHFEVERSANGSEFHQLGRVTAEGDSQTDRTYSFQDTDALLGTSFYRLRMVDLDGSFGYSSVVMVRIDGETGLLLYPNPTLAGVKLELPETHAYKWYGLYTAAGRLLREGIPGIGTNYLDLADLPPGVYHLTLKGSEGLVSLPLRKL